MNIRADHERVSELIPWFVNGSLSETEHHLVERHIGECLVCRVALKEEQRTRKLVSEQPTVHLSREAGLDAFLQRVDHNEVSSPGSYRMGLAMAASVAIAAVALWIFVDGPENGTPGGDFSTLAIPATSSVAVDVIFADGITDTELGAILSGVNGTIVAGPTSIGRYTISLSESDAVENVLDALQSDPRVRLATPSFIDGESR